MNIEYKSKVQFHFHLTIPFLESNNLNEYQYIHPKSVPTDTNPLKCLIGLGDCEEMSFGDGKCYFQDKITKKSFVY